MNVTGLNLNAHSIQAIYTILLGIWFTLTLGKSKSILGFSSGYAIEIIYKIQVKFTIAYPDQNPKIQNALTLT